MAKGDANENEVYQVIDRWARAVRENDLEGVLANHTDDILMYDVIPPFRNAGLDEYRKSWEVFFKYSKGGEGAFRLDDLNITASDTVAFTTATLRVFALKIRLTVGPRRENGRWLIAHEHHSALDEE
jgi:uncharacterized protein (TIGR02246 family)